MKIRILLLVFSSVMPFYFSWFYSNDYQEVVLPVILVIVLKIPDVCYTIGYSG